MNNDQVAWTVCLDCGKRVTGDFIHTCSPQLKTLTDEEIEEFEWVIKKHFHFNPNEKVVGLDRIIRAILRKAQEK